MGEPERIGVRELRQNASVYLRAVQGGASFEVTSNGEPVALLVPVPRAALERFYADGSISRPSSTTSWRDVTPVAAVAGKPSLSEILQAQRDDEP